MTEKNYILHWGEYEELKRLCAILKEQFPNALFSIQNNYYGSQWFLRLTGNTDYFNKCCEYMWKECLVDTKTES